MTLSSSISFDNNVSRAVSILGSLYDIPIVTSTSGHIFFSNFPFVSQYIPKEEIHFQYKFLIEFFADFWTYIQDNTVQNRFQIIGCIFITLLSDKSFKYFLTSVLEESFGVPKFTKRIPVLFKIIHYLSNSIIDHDEFEPSTE